MKKANALAMVGTCLCFAVGTPGSAKAQENFEITGFTDGRMTWSTPDTNLYYTVEWKPSLSRSNDWSGAWDRLQDIQSTEATVSADVPMFYRVVASSNRAHFAAVPLTTGQTNSFRTGDDGALRFGRALTEPRFTDNGNGTVSDNLTGLMWAKDANLWGSVNWNTAIDNCNSLVLGGTNDWRLPNIREIYSLVDFRYMFPPISDTTGSGQWSSGDPFNNIQTDCYWSSSTPNFEPAHSQARVVYMDGGSASGEEKTEPNYVWPVRGNPAAQ